MPGDADEHRPEEQPPQPPPRGPVPQIAGGRQRGIGSEDLHAQEHDHGHADVEREVLVRGTVAEVVRREREEHGADERRPTSTAATATRGTRRAR